MQVSPKAKNSFRACQRRHLSEMCAAFVLLGHGVLLVGGQHCPYHAVNCIQLLIRQIWQRLEKATGDAGTSNVSLCCFNDRE